MMKELEVINSNNIKYFIYIEERRLYLQCNEEVNELAVNVIEYKVECNKGLLFICYYNNKYEVFLIKVKLSDHSMIEVIDYEFLVDKYNFIFIDSLKIIKNSCNDIYIIFRGWIKRRDESLLLKINLLNSNEVKVVARAITHRLSTACITYSNKCADLILYSNNEDNGEYCFYNLKDEKIVGKIYLQDVCDISMIHFKDKSVIIYNKISDKNLILNYRFFIEDYGSIIIDTEQKITFNENVIKPQVSVYFSKLYFIWNNLGGLNVAVTNNMEEWSVKCFNRGRYNNFIKVTIRKITDGNIEIIKTYVDSSTIERILGNSIIDLYNSEPLISNEDNILEEIEGDTFINELYSIKDILDLQREYYELSNNYGKKVRELQNIIEEKDKIINKLLNIE